MATLNKEVCGILQKLCTDPATTEVIAQMIDEAYLANMPTPASTGADAAADSAAGAIGAGDPTTTSPGKAPSAAPPDGYAHVDEIIPKDTGMPPPTVPATPKKLQKTSKAYADGPGTPKSSPRRNTVYQKYGMVNPIGMPDYSHKLKHTNDPRYNHHVQELEGFPAIEGGLTANRVTELADDEDPHASQATSPAAKKKESVTEDEDGSKGATKAVDQVSATKGQKLSSPTPPPDNDNVDNSAPDATRPRRTTRRVGGHENRRT